MGLVDAYCEIVLAGCVHLQEMYKLPVSDWIYNLACLCVSL